MKMLSNNIQLVIVALIVIISLDVNVIKVKAYYSMYCGPATRCYRRELYYCPQECPSSYSDVRSARVCRIDCNSPRCMPQCVGNRPDCDSPGSACYDPRFIGGDGQVFYFHGKSNQHFALISDHNLQINARFIGHRPTGRTRDFTWIQSLGFLFNSHSFSLSAPKSATWDPEVDHLDFTYDGASILVPTGQLSRWTSPQENVKVERTLDVNSAIISLPGLVEILVNVVPVTKQDDKIHNYKVPSDDCFAHLEVQFRFVGLSDKVEGVLGRTYQLDFENPAKPGVAMAVVGGEDKYRTTSLLLSDCKKCGVFENKSNGGEEKESTLIVEYEKLDCSSTMISSGNGIVCKK